MDKQSQEKSGSEAQYDGRWTNQEHLRFVQALVVNGKNWKSIEEAVQTRTTSQVRSHAQKFFLKLSKIQKQRKRNLKKGITFISRAQQQLTNSLRDQALTTNTPHQIIRFLKLQPLEPVSTQPHSTQINSAFLKQQSKKRTSKMLQEMINLNEQESFLVSLIKHNMNFLGKEETFMELIDFPEIHREQKQEEETTNKRKRSFLLYEEEDQNRYTRVVKRMNGP